MQEDAYAITGVPIVLDVRVHGALMGEELPSLASEKAPQIKVMCQGTNSLDHVRMIKNGCMVHTQPCHDEVCCTLEWEDRDYNPDVPSSYYVRAV